MRRSPFGIGPGAKLDSVGPILRALRQSMRLAIGALRGLEDVRAQLMRRDAGRAFDCADALSRNASLSLVQPVPDVGLLYAEHFGQLGLAASGADGSFKCFVCGAHAAYITNCFAPVNSVLCR